MVLNRDELTMLDLYRSGTMLVQNLPCFLYLKTFIFFLSLFINGFEQQCKPEDVIHNLVLWITPTVPLNFVARMARSLMIRKETNYDYRYYNECITFRCSINCI